MLNATPEIQSVIESEDRLWTSDVAPVACLFQKYSYVSAKYYTGMLMLWFYNEPLLSGQPPLSSHLSVPQKRRLNGGSTVPYYQTVYANLFVALVTDCCIPM